MKSAATQLKEWRLSKGLTQKDAADLMKVNQVTWHGWEHGNRQPSPASCTELERISGGVLNRSDLVFGKE